MVGIVLIAMGSMGPRTRSSRAIMIRIGRKVRRRRWMLRMGKVEVKDR